ncbi:MAG TPA: hypothetical protein VIR01_02560, partial [Pyrinomonadaceae bacterium]
IYAEDGANNFLPSPGTITALVEPSGPGVRVDSGVRANSVVSIYYDPMIAKLAVWGRDRFEAIDRLKRALSEYQVVGITTTLPFFRDVVRDDEFISGRLDTGFIGRFNQRAAVETEVHESDQQADIAAIVAALEYSQQNRAPVASPSTNRWRLSGRIASLNGAQIVNKPSPSRWGKS